MTTMITIYIRSPVMEEFVERVILSLQWKSDGVWLVMVKAMMTKIMLHGETMHDESRR